MPRTVYALAALLLAACGLFALRYGLIRRLDLRPPLARILRQKFGATAPTVQARDKRPRVPEVPDSPDDGTAPFSDADQQPDVSSEPIQGTGAGASSNSASSESSGLLTKVEDAVEDLLSSLNPPRSSSGSQPQSEQDHSSQPGEVRQSGGEPGDSPEGRPGEKAGDARDSQGMSAGKSDDRQAGKQPGSGIGSQDGDKNIRQAEQLAAMGRISEIIGQRSANLTGEATVEVESTSQQLRTPYAPRGAQHSQSGAAIGRDEIPVALQTYVERYFEQVRK
jgi:hypothetical protein